MGCYADAKTCAAIFLVALTIAACGLGPPLPGSDHLTATAKAEAQSDGLNEADRSATASAEQTLEARPIPPKSRILNRRQRPLRLRSS